MDLLADLSNLMNQSKIAGVLDQLNRADIVRDLVMAKVPYAADDFYGKEAKQKMKDPLFRFKFEDLMIKVEERAQILKAQGKTVTTKNQTAKVAATTATYSSAAKSPARQNHNQGQQQRQPHQQQQTRQQKCLICNIDHQTIECTRLKTLTVDRRLEELKKRGICFKCFQGGHMARDCQHTANLRCREWNGHRECGGRHQTLLHGRVGQNQNNQAQNAQHRQNQPQQQNGNQPQQPQQNQPAGAAAPSGASA